jgi:uncharacterized membrane protein YqjE
MALMRTASPPEPVAIAPPPGDGEPSMTDLATRLAQESIELAAVELRRFAAEVRQRQADATRAATALFLSGMFATVGIATLAGGAVLYFGRAWRDHAAAALATGGLLVLLALASAWFLMFAARRLGTADHGGQGRKAEERSPGNGT